MVPDVHCHTPDIYPTAMILLRCLSRHRFEVKCLHKPFKILPSSTDLSCSGTALESVALMCQTTSYTQQHALRRRALSLISWIKAEETAAFIVSGRDSQWNDNLLTREQSPCCARRVALPTGLTMQ